MNYQEINVTIKPKSGKSEILEKNDRYTIYIREKAENGRANEAIKRLLAEYFGVEEKKVVIIKGTTSQSKTIRVYE